MAKQLATGEGPTPAAARVALDVAVPVPSARDIPLLEQTGAEVDLAQLEARFIREFSTTVPAETVRAAVLRAREALAGARLHHFVPILIERQVRAELAGYGDHR